MVRFWVVSFFFVKDHSKRRTQKVNKFHGLISHQGKGLTTSNGCQLYSYLPKYKKNP